MTIKLFGCSDKNGRMENKKMYFLINFAFHRPMLTVCLKKSNIGEFSLIHKDSLVVNYRQTLDKNSYIFYNFYAIFKCIVATMIKIL